MVCDVLDLAPGKHCCDRVWQDCEFGDVSVKCVKLFGSLRERPDFSKEKDDKSIISKLISEIMFSKVAADGDYKTVPPHHMKIDGFPNFIVLGGGGFALPPFPSPGMRLFLLPRTPASATSHILGRASEQLQKAKDHLVTRRAREQSTTHNLQHQGPSMLQKANLRAMITNRNEYDCIHSDLRLAQVF
ncbi:unnamed protein product [Cuscuta campestris]|uniref:Uncharacterized protein n=1 Tax=Cuscuta campestris TaxID=132261 RepID=A0A484KHE0_9ASTE|nr:unnamed protein product [Cuscuta campestris]